MIQPQSGEFIVTDTPLQMVTPLTPTLALVGNAGDGMILRDNLAEVNRAIIGGSQRYYLARDLGACPI